MTKIYIDKGHKILDSKYWKAWDECVPIRLNDLYRGMELNQCLILVERINKNISFSEVKEILDNQGHSGMSHSLMCSMIAFFCDKGKDFIEYIKK